MINFLHDTLINWYAENHRNLPWRQQPTPYQVWLSEVILQQTRVNQGMDYYLRFIERWPTVTDLAQASEEEVLKMWQGLGYYSRARNLHHCAQQVVKEYDGEFPADFEQLKQLKGVGNYTAAAIASIAFNLPHAVVDGNVYRVLSRLFDIDTPINNNEGQALFAQTADAIIREHTEKSPCSLKTLRKEAHLTQQELSELSGVTLRMIQAYEHPVKLQKLKVTIRFFNYLVIRVKDNIYLHKRSDNDIWRNLYDFPCIESEKPMIVEEVVSSETFLQLIDHKPFTVTKTSQVFTHKLTHRTILAQFIEINLSQELLHIETKGLILTPERDLGNYPIPRLIDLYLTT